jgi:hypothetical protein
MFGSIGLQNYIPIVTSILAIAISSLTLGWTIYRDAIRKPKFRVDIAVKKIIRAGSPQDGPYVFVEALNVGPIPNRIGLTFLQKNWIKRVGWVEPFRETHHLRKMPSMGIAPLHPSYVLKTRSRMSSAAYHCVDAAPGGDLTPHPLASRACQAPRPSPRSTTPMSYWLCRSSQNCALWPKYRPSRTAVSTVIARRPFKMSVTRPDGTPMSRDRGTTSAYPLSVGHGAIRGWPHRTTFREPC